MTCSSCKVVVHAKCAKSIFNFNNVVQSWHCNQCLEQPPKYNPFAELSHDRHDPNSLEDIEDLIEISNILNNCANYSTKTFNKLSKQLCNENSKLFSCLFNNIDGCASNFDAFVSGAVSKYKHLFSVIGIVETNIDKCHKDLYLLNDYTSTYTYKYPGKNKGSGIGLYVHNDYVFYENNEFTHCTKNLESLFVTITNTEEPITVGVFYRPPSGSVEGFLNEWESILKNLPKTNVYIMGDFDLLKGSQRFETTFYSYNFIPTVSGATHEKPGCSPSLIDNIFVNSTGNLLNSGILDEKISHHSPIFCFMNNTLQSATEENINCPKYDYCESNINSFIHKIGDANFFTLDKYDDQSFQNFVNTLNEEIESNFKVEGRVFKKSRRNFYVNPWIRPGIISSINKKHIFYKLWKKTQTKSNKYGNTELYNRFKSYRKYLKKVIKLAKKNFYAKSLKTFRMI